MKRVVSIGAFDLDGVILRHPALSKHIATRAAEYVAHRVPYLKGRDLCEFNRQLYLTHGHTYRGVCALFPEYAGTLKEYNKFMYDATTMELLQSLKNDPIMVEHSKEISKLNEECSKKGTIKVIFSNAPVEWCETASYMLGFLPEMIFGSDHPVFMEKYLKPDPILYAHIGWFLEAYYHHNEIHITFVDDSLQNLMPLLKFKQPNKYWKPIWFQPHPQEKDLGPMYQPGPIVIAHSMNDVMNYV